MHRWMHYNRVIGEDLIRLLQSTKIHGDLPVFILESGLLSDLVIFPNSTLCQLGHFRSNETKIFKIRRQDKILFAEISILEN